MVYNKRSAKDPTRSKAANTHTTTTITSGAVAIQDNIVCARTAFKIHNHAFNVSIIFIIRVLARPPFFLLFLVILFLALALANLWPSASDPPKFRVSGPSPPSGEKRPQKKSKIFFSSIFFASCSLRFATLSNWLCVWWQASGTRVPDSCQLAPVCLILAARRPQAQVPDCCQFAEEEEEERKKILRNHQRTRLAESL